MGPLTTPKKGREVGSVDPWTPTSNLKMLISAASPEIRNREKELCMDNDGRDSLESTQEPENGEESEKMISRKEKSLGLLCHKFLARYPDYPNPALNNDICLDDVATELNVERRRIYDIMNVLESLHMVSRSAKNRYTWHGRTKLAETLAILKQVGEEHRYSQQMQQIRQRLVEKEFDFDGEEKENEVAVVDLENGEHGQKELFFVELPGVEFKAASVNSRKDKSLRVMSQKFVMLFLVSNPRVVSLDVAAKILIGEDQAADQDKNKFKTKVRRLYDIANVLRSLKLIEKVHVAEERGRKPAFEWVGLDDFPQVIDSENTSTACPPKKKGVLEPRASADNCAKNLFSSPGTKRSFTRHPSLIKLAKSIQDDRRKINSAPSSPVKSDSSVNSDFPNKMAQLAAICKIELDQESVTGDVGLKPAAAEANTGYVLQLPTPTSVEPSRIPLQPPTQEQAVNTTANPIPHALLAAQPSGSVAYIPAQCSPLIPVLLPQQRGSGPYAVYLNPSSLRSNPLARPQPTSLAVRSMTFEDKTGQSPNGQSAAKSHTAADASPSGVKRLRSELASEGSPSKAKRSDPTFKDTSPKLCEILQARLKARRVGQLTSRPSPRALHLDPEFVNTPGGAVANQTLEQSLELLLDREEKVANSDSEAGLTPVRAVPLTPRQLHAETLIPAGYLIPISQQSLISYKEVQSSGAESNKISPPNIYQTPTAGSRPAPAQEITPTNLRLQRPANAASPQATQQAHRLNSPSPAILNFTLQNLGLISSSSPGSAFATPQTPERANTLTSPLPSPLTLQQRAMVFIKPLSPVHIQQTVSPHQVALIGVQQPLMATPKGSGVPQHSFFHTPVSLSPLAAVVNTAGQSSTKTVHIPQRKLDVTTDES
ncbi:transcription factor E2F8 isoform X2 [Maylandia zebra]|uniref:Transcription factor E2F8 n=2 Tax=Maylandia zebra TaxID=106582 RepID=A0A3P9CB36_9CICH|nr:transcription factor E2F8 isoform X2 [Astatotilapia calliptera]